MELFLLTIIYSICCNYSKGAILKDPEDEDVRSMSRTSSPSELLYGPLQMTLIMSYVGLTKFMTNVGVIIMGSFVGDWMAAMVGLNYGKHRYKVPLGGDKSVEGTIGCVIGTMGGIWFYSYMTGVEVVGWRMLLAYGCISALVEATALKNWDNLLLAVVLEMSAKHLPNYVFR
jgi:dolichol kinase